jgi:hypothetical protein
MFNNILAVSLCTHKICQLFRWPGSKDLHPDDLKSRIRIRTKSFSIQNRDYGPSINVQITPVGPLSSSECGQDAIYNSSVLLRHPPPSCSNKAGHWAGRRSAPAL